jgi:hypothetical protein
MASECSLKKEKYRTKAILVNLKSPQSSIGVAQKDVTADNIHRTFSTVAKLFGFNLCLSIVPAGIPRQPINLKNSASL